MQTETLTASTRKLITSLKNARHRREERLFVIEGTRAVTDTAPFFDVACLVATAAWLDEHGAALPAAIGRVAVAKNDDIVRMSSLNTPQGVIAVCRMPEAPEMPEQIAPDELVLVARTGGPYSRTESITADELREIPLVLREGGSGTLEVIKAALGRAGIRIPQLNVVMRLGSTEGIKAFVRNSDAMAIVSVISVVDELRSGVLRIIDLEDLPLRRDFAFVHVEAEPSALVRQFIEFARADR